MYRSSDICVGVKLSKGPWSKPSSQELVEEVEVDMLASSLLPLFCSVRWTVGAPATVGTLVE